MKISVAVACRMVCGSQLWREDEYLSDYTKLPVRSWDLNYFGEAENGKKGQLPRHCNCSQENLAGVGILPRLAFVLRLRLRMRTGQMECLRSQLKPQQAFLTQLLCARHMPEPHRCMSLMNPHNSPGTWALGWLPFNRWRHWVLRRPRMLSEIIPLVNGRVRV